MREVVKRPRAKEDPKKFWHYSFEEWGEVQAEKYLTELDAGIQQLKDNPELARNRDEVRPGYRSLHVNRHIIFFTMTPSLIRIIRVLHDRMEPLRHL